MKILLSPHDDDHVLFGSFICMREKPLIVIVTDSYIQPNRGEVGCSAAERAAETAAACEVLGCKVLRLGIHDDFVTTGLVLSAMSQFASVECVYAPAFQGGNPHHDMVAHAAEVAFTGILKKYTTYTKAKLHTEGDFEIKPTAEELAIKNKALDCYPSQQRINRAHFDAVIGKSEWLVA